MFDVFSGQTIEEMRRTWWRGPTWTTQILEDGPYADTELNCKTYLAVINKDGRFCRQQSQWLTLKLMAQAVDHQGG